MCNLLKTENEILKKGNGIGNEVLYKLCKDINILDINNKKYTDGLAAQMWLIGRSYAASPERRGYKPIKGTKIEYTASGNGLDDYFDKLADGFVNSLKKDPNSDVNRLFEPLTNVYTLIEKDTDTDILKYSITAVLELNYLLKQVRFKIDEDDLKDHINNNHEKYKKKYPTDTVNKAMEDFENNNKNMISFCSKFLHFHFPNTVFIFDSITKSHFKGYGNPYQFNFEDGKSKIEIYKSKKREDIIIESVASMLSREELTPQEKEYATHCIREYFLAKEINNRCNNIFKDKYIPRVVDTYMLIANS